MDRRRYRDVRNLGRRQADIILDRVLVVRRETLIVSYLIAATLGVIIHVICVKLGLWRLWHYVLAGLLGGLVPAALWALSVSPMSTFPRIATITVPSALAVAVMVWLMVFWRNPPAAQVEDA